MKKKLVLVLLSMIPFLNFAQNDRAIWVNEMVKMADPVLVSLSEGKLKENMPTEQSSFEYGDRSSFAHLEAFGRLMAGMAPWLELGKDSTDEGQLRKKYIELTHKAIRNAVDPESSDYMNFSNGNQPLVDVAFLAQAFIRAPNEMWEPLDDDTKRMVIEAFKKSRTISDIPYNNWLLFAASVEAFMIKFTDDADYVRIEYALQKHMEWYVGDGLYADGKYYHWDYYNSFVIHPMLIDILSVLQGTKYRLKSLNETVLKRAQRYGEILERQISPIGTFPIVGRSTVYRFGVFQALSQLVLLEKLPVKLSEGQVRSGLTAVLKKLQNAKGLYDKNGWLQIGVFGHQPDMAEPYISTGSLYLTSLGFLSLGLPEHHSFWTAAPEDWTSVKIWGGNPSVKRDKYSN
ncbi:DUF2264 domain-containing protein [Flavivirga spongiicola]|uniref:DUF2264 domain-containing protein n=1 Tax=Flavivirga spongiicola TaxID=421621 RepID=A0ABU7XXP1_9FLAO|nr:DUF2264 domain-containing protein [Flavivirga sp. MEBiC05379]MDO5980165.1 DUF2264 domain-containing protein [Flavivirga sp. MEBiC05379]MDO5981913.1 DUF2264 domain-containing protein [Flavivirga sp. MEBiC05379]